MSTRNTPAISRRSSNMRPLRKDIQASAPESYRHLFLNHKGKVSDKWEHYLSVYELELRPMISFGAPLQLLEIGVQNGGSLEIWRKFLPEGSSIVGIDVDSRCKKLRFHGNIELHIADAADPEALRSELGDRQFDIIVDDGSHQQADILSTFHSLFPRLKVGGKYLVEDLHASYWSSHGGAYLKPDTAIEYFKNLIDAQNVDYIQGDVGDVGLSREELQQFGADIGRVSFYDSIFIVEKYARRKSAPFRRLITGRKMEVTPLLSYVDAMANAPASIVMVGPIREDGLGAIVGELNRARSELAELKLHIAQVAEEPTEVGDPSARAETEALRADLSRLGDAHAALSEDLSKLHEELAVRASSVEQLQAALRDRATELEAATHQLAARDARVLELEAAVNSSLAAAAELEAQVAEKASSVEQLQTALRDRAAELEAATHQLAARDARVLELEAAVNSSSAAAAELEAQVVEKASSVEQLQTALRDRATELEAATHQLAARDARVLELEAAVNSSSAAAAELEAQVVEKASSVEQLQTALRDRAAELEAATHQLAARDARVLELEAAVNSSSAATAELEAQVAERDSMMERCQADVRQAGEEVARLEEKLSAQNALVLESEATTRRVTAESSRFEAELAERDLRIVQLQAGFRQRSVEFDLLGAKLAACETHLMGAQAHSNSLTAEIARLEGAAAESERQRAELQAALHQKEAELAAHVAVQEATAANVAELEIVVASKVEKLTHLEMELASQQSRVVALEPLSGIVVEAEALRLSLSESEASLRRSEDENASLRGRVADLEGNLVALKDTIAAKEDREGELHRTIDALNLSLNRLQQAWVFRLDSLLVRRMKTSAFGLATPSPLLLTSSGSSL